MAGLNLGWKLRVKVVVVYWSPSDYTLYTKNTRLEVATTHLQSQTFNTNLICAGSNRHDLCVHNSYIVQYKHTKSSQLVPANTTNHNGKAYSSQDFPRAFTNYAQIKSRPIKSTWVDSPLHNSHQVDRHITIQHKSAVPYRIRWRNSSKVDSTLTQIKQVDSTTTQITYAAKCSNDIRP